MLFALPLLALQESSSTFSTSKFKLLLWLVTASNWMGLFELSNGYEDFEPEVMRLRATDPRFCKDLYIQGPSNVQRLGLLEVKWRRQRSNSGSHALIHANHMSRSSFPTSWPPPNFLL
ncbi:hypothetical protein ACB098_01G034100 [Castanea mollissima]